MTNQEIEDRLIDLDADGQEDFLILDHDASRHTAAKPLVVIVHPGDMIEVEEGWGSILTWKRVLKDSLARQKGTATELLAWRERGADFVLLHRSSCSWILAGGSAVCDEHFAEEIGLAREAGTVLFSDDLDPAGAWIVDHLHIAQRPEIFMAGAYADDEHGCLTAIGRILETVARGRITVSAHSPAPSGERWQPNSGKVAISLRI